MRRADVWRLVSLIALAVSAATSVAAQEPQDTTRVAVIEQEQAEKAKNLQPPVPGKIEGLMNRAEDILVNGVPRWHPFFDSAYYGGGFILGAGYAHHVSPYNQLDVRGSYTILNYKRIEAELTVPRLFHRRGTLSLLGGWREATQAAFYGFGMGTSKDDRADFDFRQPYGSATFTFRPTRRLLMLRGGLEVSQWWQRPAEGSDFPSVETVYTPDTLPGLGAKITYLHSQGTVGFDWRTSPGYTRRGGFYGVTLHDYADKDEQFGFQQIDYEAIQHVPILREAWVISLRAIARTTNNKDGQQVPFFLLPYVGSGSTLRGFTSHRFREANGLTLQAEWRIMANRFMDTAVFYDTGKVAASRSDLDFDGMKSDYGFGVRLPRTVLDAVAGRGGKESRGAEADLLDLRRSFEADDHAKQRSHRHTSVCSSRRVR